VVGRAGQGQSVVALYIFCGWQGSAGPIYIFCGWQGRAKVLAQAMHKRKQNRPMRTTSGKQKKTEKRQKTEKEKKEEKQKETKRKREEPQKGHQNQFVTERIHHRQHPTTDKDRNTVKKRPCLRQETKWTPPYIYIYIHV